MVGCAEQDSNRRWLRGRMPTGRALVVRATGVRAWLVLAGMVWSMSALAQEGPARPPDSLAQDVRPLAEVQVIETPPVDVAAMLAEDEEAGARDDVPLRFASPVVVSATPAGAGLWETPGDGDTSVWRLRVRSAGAVSMNLGFVQYDMPPGGRLLIYTPDHERIAGPFTDADNESHRELWTPVLPGGEVVIEVVVPTRLIGDMQIELGSVNRGYRAVDRESR